MSERRRILELFEQQKDYLEEKINSGIENNRKGTFNLKIVQKNGEPIPGAKVFVNQKSHEFRFGANIFMLDGFETEEKNKQYKAAFADVFNMATLPFYWDTLEPEKGKPRYEKGSPFIYRRPPIDRCMEFCAEHNIEPREHALAYDHFFPKWLHGCDNDEVKRQLERRFAEISERYADKIPTIEVTNEMEWKEGVTDFYDAPEFVEYCFKLAEKYFPENKLGINEGTNLAWEDRCRATDKYYSYIEANMLRGVRIDAIGMQYHLFIRSENEYEQTRKYLNPESLYRHMDLYSRFGKPLQVTEVTLPAYSDKPEDEEIQAEMLEKLYSIWFSHPNTEQIIYWNLVDGYAHVNYTDPEKILASQGDMTLGENYFYGGLLRFDMTPKPAFLKLKELIQKRWHTEESINTNACGEAEINGFYGDYEVSVEALGKTVTKKISLLKKGKKNISIVL